MKLKRINHSYLFIFSVGLRVFISSIYLKITQPFQSTIMIFFKSCSNLVKFVFLLLLLVWSIKCSYKSFFHDDNDKSNLNWNIFSAGHGSWREKGKQGRKSFQRRICLKLQFSFWMSDILWKQPKKVLGFST